MIFSGRALFKFLIQETLSTCVNILKIRHKKAPKDDVVTTKPTGGRLPMTVENLQMSADKPDIVDKPSTLYHYTSEKGLTGIFRYRNSKSIVKKRIILKMLVMVMVNILRILLQVLKSNGQLSREFLCYTMEIQANFSLS